MVQFDVVEADVASLILVSAYLSMSQFYYLQNLIKLFFPFSSRLQGYLKEKGCYEALSGFILETNLSSGAMGEELLFLQKLVLQGRYDILRW